MNWTEQDWSKMNKKPISGEWLQPKDCLINKIGKDQAEV